MEKENIKLKQSIIHILDQNSGIPVLSDSLLDVSIDTHELITSHIFKILSGDDFKKCTFTEDHNFIINELNSYNPEYFITMTKNLASSLYEIMKKNINIPAADVLFTVFTVKEVPYLAILKMNYKTSFVHNVETIGSETNNSIIKHQTVLPSSGQRLDEAIIISFADYSIKLVERKFEIDGNKEYYLSQYYLECAYEHSSKTKVNLLTKTVDQFNKKYYNDDIENKLKFKEAIINEIEEKGNIDVQNVADKVFENNIELKEEFKEKLDRYGLTEKPIEFQSETVTRKIEKQKIKTDKGIEINIPVEVYNRDVEFTTNVDGSIDIKISNVKILK